MTFQTLAEVVRDRMNEGADAANEMADCIRPIYGADDRGRPLHIGTALLLDLKEGPHILTAAHVIDWCEETTLYLGLHTQVELPSPFLTTEPPDGDRSKDVVDVAIRSFPKELLGSLGSAKFLPEDQIVDVPGSCVGRTYTCIGFPNSQNRTPPRSQPNILHPQTRIYTSTGADYSRLPNRAVPVAHILINFDFKFSRTMDGRRTASGRPEGMSGGAVFDLGNLGDPATLMDPIRPKLAGLFIEAHRGPGVILATRIAPTLRWFRRLDDFASMGR